MKLTRMGWYRNHGATKLASRKIDKSKRREWNEAHRRNEGSVALCPVSDTPTVIFSLHAAGDRSEYLYQVELTKEELESAYALIVSKMSANELVSSLAKSV